MIKIFDSLGHATVSGNWLSGGLNSSFSKYSEELNKYNYIGGLAVGLHGKDGYSHVRFIKECKQYKNLFPIAGIDPNKILAEELLTLKEMGFLGAKIHPRFSSVDIKRDKSRLIDVLNYAEHIDFPILICTYFHCRLHEYPKYDPLYELIDLLSAVNTKVMLVHGGDISLMRYAEMTRFNNNLLLDLSLTLMKYEGSSIDMDLKFLFSNFDRRVCVGSDFPEYSLNRVRERVEYFCKGLPASKIDNITHKNIMKFFKIPAE